jgi:hypothetical protein
MVSLPTYTQVWRKDSQAARLVPSLKVYIINQAHPNQSHRYHRHCHRHRHITTHIEPNIKRVVNISRSLRLDLDRDGVNIVERSPFLDLDRIGFRVSIRVLNLDGVVENESFRYNIVPIIPEPNPTSANLGDQTTTCKKTPDELTSRYPASP